MTTHVLSLCRLHSQGSLALQTLGGDAGPLSQHAGLLRTRVRLLALQQEVADEELQALSQHAQLRAVGHPGKGVRSCVSVTATAPRSPIGRRSLTAFKAGSESRA